MQVNNQKKHCYLKTKLAVNLIAWQTFLTDFLLHNSMKKVHVYVIVEEKLCLYADWLKKKIKKSYASQRKCDNASWMKEIAVAYLFERFELHLSDEHTAIQLFFENDAYLLQWCQHQTFVKMTYQDYFLRQRKALHTCCIWRTQESNVDTLIQLIVAE